MATFSVYLIRCRDQSVYTGIATDVERRLAEHEEGTKGAKFLRGKGPLTLIYTEKIGNRSLASKIESRVKGLPKADKEDVAVLKAHIRGFVSECQSPSA